MTIEVEIIEIIKLNEYYIIHLKNFNSQVQ